VVLWTLVPSLTTHCQREKSYEPRPRFFDVAKRDVKLSYGMFEIPSANSQLWCNRNECHCNESLRDAGICGRWAA
jgi:hypothetical protein